MGMTFAFLDIPELLTWCLGFVLGSHLERCAQPIILPRPWIVLTAFLMTGLSVSSFPPVALNSVAISF